MRFERTLALVPPLCVLLKNVQGYQLESRYAYLAGIAFDLRAIQSDEPG
ncbi:MAG: hypothetical protein RLZ17_629, partial [Actinomycetota bacterium]